MPGIPAFEASVAAPTVPETCNSAGKQRCQEAKFDPKRTLEETNRA